MGAMSQVEYALMKLDDDKEITKILQGAYHDCERVASLVNNLSKFTPKDTRREKINTSLNKVLNTLVSDLPGLPFYYPGVEIMQNITDRRFTAKVKEKDLYQWCLRIIENSFEALKKSSFKKISFCARKERNNIILTIKDNGHGIDKENLKKTFEPFFTTKDIGEGLGLSLAVMHTEIKNKGGDINISSNGKSQTTVTITLPIGTEDEPS